MKKSLLSIILCLSINIVFAQDLIYTVFGELNETKTALDSILVENLTNSTKILFGDLPPQEYYQINLTKNAYWGTVGINDAEKAPEFVVAANSPGMLTINYMENSPVNIRLSVYTISGQRVYLSERKMLNARNSISVKLSNASVFFVRVEAPGFTQTFKAIGADNVTEHSIEIADRINERVTTKSGIFISDTEFSFIPGDTIKISVYIDGFYAKPRALKIDSSKFVNFLIEENSNAVISSFIDFRDINTYKTVKIGNQEWMAENLAYLPSVSSSSAKSYTEPYYYVYGYQGTSVSAAKATDNYSIYGVLYNWPAAKAACPSGWHLPSDAEWKQMEMAIGMSQSEADDTGWRGTNEGSQLAGNASLWSNGNLKNSSQFGTSGFSGLPGGYRNYIGDFYGITSNGIWWSATEHSTLGAWRRGLHYLRTTLLRSNRSKEYGFSVRCVRD